jgi:hypothetical protein
MPKKDMDYSKCLIYKLVCDNFDVKDCYVGHTTNFKQRKRQHKCNTNNPNSKLYNLKVYEFIRENGGWTNWSMVLVEYFPCNDELEARARERFWYENLNGSLNSQYPNRSVKEYYNDNKNIIKNKHKIYNENKKEQIAEYQKEYRENNKEEIAEYHKEYKKNNKQKIEERITRLITCECGGEFQYISKYRHIKSKNHLNYIQFTSSKDNLSS